ncbi:MAG: membrane protein insertase YidC [Acidobacteriota bacterium]|nr:membrane protein insertase YidC [Acidobacteriota bacterium]MDE3043642.1 membrane protein insertase YidC [Acidobacteriota bacterium]
MSSFIHAISTIFHPIFAFFGFLLAFFYSLIPNYAVAIVLLTVVIMGALTPFTIKSTKSMMSMQKLQPEIKKLQVKYKGPENRQLLNDELMKLYREEGVNPLGGCLPLLLQAPFLFILYSVIKGLSYTKLVKGAVVAEPRYIPHTSKMYENLVHSGGQIKVFGMDLSLKSFSSHGSFAAAIPFFVFVAVAVGLQYFQMAQMNNRNKKSGQTMPSQQQAMQRFLPIIFAYFYLVIPAAVVLYMIVSTIIRIITQDLMFRTGVSNPIKNGVERVLPPAEKSSEASKKAPNTETKPSTLKAQPRSRAKKKRKAR